MGSILLLGWAAWEFRSISTPENPSFDLQFSFAAIAALLASYHLFAHELTPLILLAYLILGYEEVARSSESLLGRSSTQLLLLIPIVMIVGSALRFRAFSVLFVALFGLLVWLSQENRRMRSLRKDGSGDNSSKPSCPSIVNPPGRSTASR